MKRDADNDTATPGGESKDIAFFVTGLGDGPKTLYTLENGKTVEKITEELHLLYVSPTAVYYTIRKDRGENGYNADIYASAGDTAFKLLARDISILS